MFLLIEWEKYKSTGERSREYVEGEDSIFISEKWFLRLGKQNPFSYYL